MRDNLLYIISATGITGIEILDKIHLPEILKFGGQSVIGVLTIVYLYLKIKKLNK
jgi:hypothetical protein